MIEVTMDIKEDWVMIPTSELGKEYKIGKIIESYRNNIKVLWQGKDVQRIGIYTVRIHQILIPSMTDWIQYAELHGAWDK